MALDKATEQLGSERRCIFHSIMSRFPSHFPCSFLYWSGWLLFVNI